MEIINKLLRWTGGASTLSFIGCAFLIARYLICNNTCLYYLVASTIIWVGTLILLLVLLWLKKEMHLEEVRRDMRVIDLIKKEKNSYSNEELSKKLEELKASIKEVALAIKKV